MDVTHVAYGAHVAYATNGFYALHDGNHVIVAHVSVPSRDVRDMLGVHCLKVFETCRRHVGYVFQTKRYVRGMWLQVLPVIPTTTISNTKKAAITTNTTATTNNNK